MTPRQRRMTLVFGIIAGVGIAGALALSAFRSNVTFFFDPSQVADGKVKEGEHFRLGGMVEQGSVKRLPGSLEVRFVVTDFKHEIPVTYDKVLPDLFREGTGVVAHGHMSNNGTFVADEVLAKHDEKYMPPEVAKSLKRRHGEAREDALNTPSAEQAQPNESAQGQPPSTTSTQAPSATSPLGTAAQASFASSATPANAAGRATAQLSAGAQGQPPSTVSSGPNGYAATSNPATSAGPAPPPLTAATRTPAGGT